MVVTGSYGRHEASDQSDLDYFIIGREAERSQAPHQQVADILGKMVTKKPAVNGPFSSYITAEELVNRIGLDGDTNSITTRRLLFLLECEWLYNEAGKRKFFDDLIANYVTSSVTRDSIARFLVNDVIRYYRTISVDFEIKTREGDASKAWAPRRLKLVFRERCFISAALSQQLKPQAVIMQVNVKSCRNFYSFHLSRACKPYLVKKPACAGTL